MSNNDVSGVSANAISIDDGRWGPSTHGGYDIVGNGITLGAGGITAAPSTGDTASGGALLNLPITLGASQTWSITGGSHNQQLAIGGAVTGGADALTVNLSGQTFLSFLAGDSEVGAVTVTGSGGSSGDIGLGQPGSSTSLNGTNGHAVSFSGGAGLFADGSASLGALSMSGGQVQVGEGITQTGQPDAVLSVNGTAALDSTSDLSMSIDNAGTTPGTDYTQLNATGNINLGSATLFLRQGQNASGMTISCAVLNPGDVDTLVSTSGGSLSGTFAGIPNNTTISLSPSRPGATAPTVRINYTSTAVTATVVTSGSCGATSTTTLSNSPASPVTNQTVTLTATVTASSGTPSGTVEFDNNGMAIPGCTSQPVAFDGSAYTATCQTSFTAASSPESLQAFFTPSSTSLQTSASGVVPLTVGKDSTTTALSVSNATPGVGASVTYTATVTPGHAGATEPSGSVQFLDGGTPIGGCAAQPLTAGPSSSTATCTLSYPVAGSHSITAVYGGDANFTGSTSSAQTVTVPPPPPLPTHTLTVALAGAGSGTVSGSGISCPGTCSSSFASGTAVSLTATAAAGSTFAGWTGGCTGTGVCKLTLNSDQAVTAAFTANQPSPPKCSLKPIGSRVTVLNPKKANGSKHPNVRAGTISLIAECDQSVTITLNGTIAEQLRKRHGKQQTKLFNLATVHGSLTAGVAKTLKLNVPAALVLALKHGVHESAAFTLIATNTNGNTQVTYKLSALRL